MSLKAIDSTNKSEYEVYSKTDIDNMIDGVVGAIEHSGCVSIGDGKMYIGGMKAGFSNPTIPANSSITNTIALPDGIIALGYEVFKNAIFSVSCRTQTNISASVCNIASDGILTILIHNNNEMPSSTQELGIIMVIPNFN